MLLRRMSLGARSEQDVEYWGVGGHVEGISRGLKEDLSSTERIGNKTLAQNIIAIGCPLFLSRYYTSPDTGVVEAMTTSNPTMYSR